MGKITGFLEIDRRHRPAQAALTSLTPDLRDCAQHGDEGKGRGGYAN
jgi:hypothetical protein